MVENYISSQPPEYQILLEKIRNFILNLAPQMQESFKWQVPFFEYYGLFCYLNVNLKKEEILVGFYRGAALSNSQGLLRGEGKQVKHLIFSPNQEFSEEIVLEVFQEAMILNENLWKEKKNNKK